MKLDPCFFGFFLTYIYTKLFLEDQTFDDFYFNTSREIGECFQQLAHDLDCRTIVLTAAGKIFSSGNRSFIIQKLRISVSGKRLPLFVPPSYFLYDKFTSTE